MSASLAEIAVTPVEEPTETIIGSSIVIDGEIHGQENLVVEGEVKGKIYLLASLIVMESGRVEADVETESVDISGQLLGNITATNKVELQSACRIKGDIKSPRILIADGALFRGSVDMDS